MIRTRIVAAACLLALSLSPAFAQEALSPPHVRVSGEATLSVAPDTARLRAGVTATATTARGAGEANAKAMTSVMAAIRAAGVDDKDMQTSRYAIQPTFSDTSPRKITGYTASNNVTLTIRNLDGLGGLIDKLTAAGANAVGSIEFVVSDANKLLDKVRADALADARRKAQIYAEASGAKLGGVLALSEQVNTPMPMVAMMRAAPAADTPIAAGESALHVSVNVAFELMRL